MSPYVPCVFPRKLFQIHASAEPDECRGGYGIILFYCRNTTSRHLINIMKWLYQYFVLTSRMGIDTKVEMI
jgi:hypothetical protein